MIAPSEPVFRVQRGAERAFYDHGWLKTYHSFSFAEYVDPHNQNWGALRVLNDDTVAPGQGFPTHSHRDMEIVTYVLEGRLEHKDSMGNVGVVSPGGVQYMSAGIGVRHSEYNHSKVEPLHFLQMWVLPGKLDTEPSYGEAAFADAERLNTWLAIASGRHSVDAPVRLTQDAAFLVTRLESGNVLRHTFDPGRFGFLFIADGSLDVEATSGERLLGKSEFSSGDALRIMDVERIALRGDGLAVLWDVPHA